MTDNKVFIADLRNETPKDGVDIINACTTPISVILRKLGGKNIQNNKGAKTMNKPVNPFMPQQGQAQPATLRPNPSMGQTPQGQTMTPQQPQYQPQYQQQPQQYQQPQQGQYTQTQTPQTNIAPPPPMTGAPAGNGEFVADLTNIESQYIIPDGNYKVRCIDVEQGVSKKGNPQFIWTFTITDGEYAGRDFKLFTALTPSAMWKVAETVTAMGVGQIGQVVRFRKQDVLNRECGAEIMKTEYDGKENSQIQKLMTLAQLYGE